MARVSRKVSLTAPKEITQPIIEKTTYHAAVYARLSAEDKRIGKGNSLETQILLVKKYIDEAPDLSLYDVFSDNGVTGMNFERPGFEQLMDEIRSGNINCIVVKDLSRFGRDYIEAGNFLEVIFPRLGIRFISITDNYDSFDPRCQGEGMCIALKNMINAFYAKDISIKTRTAYETKQRKGEFLGGCPPFGYLRSPENKNKLIVDKDVAEIVRDIFNWKSEGMGLKEISRRLNEQGTPTPGHYHYTKGTYCNKLYRTPIMWRGDHVRMLLDNPVYLGHMVNGKARVNKNQAYDYIKQPKENWIVVKNTHEALISQELFDIVAAQLQKNRDDNLERISKNPQYVLPENIFQRLVFCSDCGGIIQRRKTISKDKDKLYINYYCPHCSRNSNKKTRRKYLRLESLQDAVYAGIMNQIVLCADKRKKFTNVVSSSQKLQEDINAKIRALKREYNHFSVKRKKLYDDFCDGLITESEYRLFNECYNKRNEEIPILLSRLENENNKYQPEFINKNSWIRMFEKFRDAKELTRDMLTALIERIEINAEMKVDIKYRYMDEYSILDEFIIEKKEPEND